MKTILKLFSVVLFIAFFSNINAQDIQYSRSNNQNGLNVFEPTKADSNVYMGNKVAIGGNFSQAYQILKHENNNPDNSDTKALYPLGNGFNLASANLNLNVSLGDGVRVYLENYMASRHHNEFWVKGGYIQFDKLPMFDNPDWFTKYVRVKIGHMEVDYGDSHFRRSDGGNAFFNPFIENNIMDEFATEIGGEVYIFPSNKLMFMFGLTNGLIKHDEKDYSDATEPTEGFAVNGKNPSILLKAAYDDQIDENLRFRLSASMYTNSKTPRNTIFGGDRTGSNYFLVMEAPNANSTDNAFSGRFNPGFSNQITTFAINPFVKYRGLEFFGTFESASGRTNTEADKRKATQLAGDLVYRFLENEQLYVGLKYNTVKARLKGYTTDVTVNRVAFAAGWYPTKNLLLKGEYVNQTYDGYDSSSRLDGGKFNGLVIQAVVGF